MREVIIRKLCLNICVGESGDRLTRAAKVRNEEKKNSSGSHQKIIQILGIGTTYRTTACIFQGTIHRSIIWYSS